MSLDAHTTTGKRARSAGSNYDDAQPRKSSRISSSDDRDLSPSLSRTTKQANLDYDAHRKQAKNQRRKVMKIKGKLTDFAIGDASSEEANNLTSVDDRDSLSDMEVAQDYESPGGYGDEDEAYASGTASQGDQDEMSALYTQVNNLDAMIQAESTMRQSELEQPIPEGKGATLRRDGKEYQAMRQRIAELESFKITQMHIFEQRRLEDSEKDKKIAQLKALLQSRDLNSDGVQARLDAKQAEIDKLQYQNRLLTRTVSSIAKLASRATLLVTGQPAFGQRPINAFTHPGYIAQLLTQAEAAQADLSRSKEATPAVKSTASNDNKATDDSDGVVLPSAEEERKATKKFGKEDQARREQVLMDHRRERTPSGRYPEAINKSIKQRRVNTKSSTGDSFTINAASVTPTPKSPSQDQHTRREKQGVKQEHQKSAREVRARSRDGFGQDEMDQALANSLNDY